MAHFAQLDENNVVLQVIVVANSEIIDDNQEEQESLGLLFCSELLGGTWKQTSYNGNIRKNFAGVGYTYDTELDAFIPPQPYPSWVLVNSTCQWEPPVPMPADGATYRWDENTISWERVII
jgi:hypothetical protein